MPEIVSYDARKDPGAIYIGSDQTRCDLWSSDAAVSAVHCRLVAGPGERYYLLEDLGSTNGTFLAGKRLAKGRRMAARLGDEIGLGLSVRFTLAAAHVLKLTDPDRHEAPTPLSSPGEHDTAAEADAVGVNGFRPDRAHDDEAHGLAVHVYLGVSHDNDIILAHPAISWRHARIVWDAGGFLIEDLGSTNGTFVRGESVARARISPGEEFALGPHRMVFGSSVLSVLRKRRRELTERLNVHGGQGTPVRLGRAADNDVIISAPVVSLHHCVLTPLPAGQGWVVKDLDSTNGTFHASPTRRIDEAVAEPDDVIFLGSYRLPLARLRMPLVPPSAETPAARPQVAGPDDGELRVRADGIGVRVPGAGGRQLLSDVSFTVYPTELVGILGPSGAGKTTLLQALIGEIAPSEGRSLFNGWDIADRTDLRRRIGYVPQDDLVHPELTVREALRYTAELRLPPSVGPAAAEARIDAALEQLDLVGAADTRIGDALHKGISGGQRKRVNLAQELVTDPPLLCLDEPTSGLASGDALQVLKVLRRVADGGRTVLMTIHQPSLQCYRQLDHALYVMEGRLVWYGPAYPDSLLWFQPDLQDDEARDHLLADPGSAMAALDADLHGPDPRAAADLRDAAYRESEAHERYVAQRALGDSPDAIDSAGGERPEAVAAAPALPGLVRQWSTLCRRWLRIRIRDVGGTALTLAQAPAIGALILLAYDGRMGEGRYPETLANGPSALFLMVVAAIWFGCQAAAREIVSERAILRRERMAGLRITSYVLSKLTVLTATAMVQCALLLLVLHRPLGLRAGLVDLFAVLLLGAVGGLGMGLLASALSRSGVQATTLVPLCLLPQIVFAGAVAPLHEMPALAQQVSNVVVARWAYEAALQIEYGKDDEEAIRKRCGQGRCSRRAADTASALPLPLPRPPVEVHFGRGAGTAAVGLSGAQGRLAGLDIAFAFAVWLVLVRRRSAG